MKQALLLPFILLGTVLALHLENDIPHLEILETEVDLGQDLDGSGDQDGELAFTDKLIKSEQEEVEASGYQDAFKDEVAIESYSAALRKDLQCPREEDTVQLQGSPWCKDCHYRLVKTLKTFKEAENICYHCYKGHLVSIHKYPENLEIQRFARNLDQPHIWIGGTIRGWWLWKGYCWTDESPWNFEYWASGQPENGNGHCVTLCTKDGHWERISCERTLPFVCSA
ncbi:proteoglycan 3 [Otolemur garnettii]|uniref:Proteoglycan 3, pro eosinophil major basic protein 2 n=2 Tax=Otolemur garnettii TaxID=30611 RepID=H0WL97_OTOGA|nr:proteoglycan 3 [Otolemur garnettii]